MPKVWNRRDPNCPADAVYVGRPTKFGNPFKVSAAQPRGTAIELFRRWVYEPEQDWLHTAAQTELRGKDLVCWCAPRPCHADIWMEIANANHP